MAINKRILDKIEKHCAGDQAMIDFMRHIIVFEFSESKQYTSEYTEAIKKYSKKSGDK